MYLSIKDIEQQVNELADILHAPAGLLPTYGYSRDFAYPHIEVDGSGLLHYEIIERGQEQDRKTTADLEQLLYWIFCDVTFSLASQYELQHRQEDQDSRRLLFRRQEELLGLLRPAWQQAQQQEHAAILQWHPFDDLAGLRAAYCRELRKQGVPETAIWPMALEKYPLT